METKHTPGPWHVYEAAPEGCREIRGSARKVALAVTVGLADDAKDAANARLIAAAPELLAALADCIDVLTEPGMMDVDEWKTWKKRAESAGRAAIAKAEGRS